MSLARTLRYAQWTLNGYVGKAVSAGVPQRVTVLITYFHPARMQHIEPQVRNILKCTFVEKLVISNHNPDVRIEDRVRIRDSRLVFMDQEVRRGCGYRWYVANELNPEYLIVVDDDVLFFPSQLARLFENLVSKPEIPHGIAGMLYRENALLEYHEKENRVVDFLCETYAVTGSHLKRYLELKKLIAKNDIMTEMIDSAADFMLISQTGTGRPHIHNVGRLLKSTTFKQPGVAVHKRADFDQSLVEIGCALMAAGELRGAMPCSENFYQVPRLPAKLAP